LAADYAISENTTSSVEIALSNNDLNTFSTKDNGDNIGEGIKANIENKLPLSDFLLPGWRLKTGLNYEMITKHFSPIERYRSVEFERDWNRINSLILNDQHIIGALIGIEKNKTSVFDYRFNSFIEKNNYRGHEQALHGNINTSGFLFDFDGSLLKSTANIYNSEFLRQKSSLSKTLKCIIIGVKETQEQSRFKDVLIDTLKANSFRFFEWQTFLTNTDSSKTKYMLNYTNRTDWAVAKNTFKKSTLGENISVGIEMGTQTNQTFKSNITYRKLSILDSALSLQKPENAVLGRVEYAFRLLKGTFSFTSFYEIGSGLEVKKEFSYLEVATGQGIYAWKDYNENGVKELNEFEIAVFNDQANYIKVFIPTNQYIKTYNNQFNQGVNIAPAALWTNKKGIKKFLANFSNQTAYRIERKTNNNELLQAFNPF